MSLLEAAKNTLLILSALFPIVNPLGGSPIFLTMTRDYSPSERRALARRVAVNSFFLLSPPAWLERTFLPFSVFPCRSFRWAAD